ncbi:MAG: glycine C-acetyltransferase [Phycisphaerae bacterium]|nr:glycine C-acetyltransferase [Phycisphaerae bacterium]MCZ2398293.1 glycine C-acetyltransferase [Phycisphaerae bacterium]NUQ49595.1 glycine C-acetyltransferase [Phycisphaerae bacterium]
MSTTLEKTLAAELAQLREARQYKQANEIQAPQAPHTRMDGKPVINLSSNNYLALANHPRVVEAGKRAIDKFGLGTASVRFICGTMSCHVELERKIRDFLGCEAATTYISCWDANVGVMPTLCPTPDDAIFSDALNHASIIDAIRLSKAQRFIFRHADYDELERMLDAPEGRKARNKLIITDGVFSMEGDIADLPRLKQLANQHDALLVVDESHATGVLGETGRGTAEHFGVLGEGTLQTSTLGKALGGACGGYVAGAKVVCDYLVQKSRPQLFSNALPPSVCYGAMAAIDVLMQDGRALLGRLRENTARFRAGVKELGLRSIDGITPIVPVIVGETATAIAMQKALFEDGVFVSGFGFPVVPKGEARLRCQISAGHTKDDLDTCLAALKKVAEKFPESRGGP